MPTSNLVNAAGKAASNVLKHGTKVADAVARNNATLINRVLSIITKAAKQSDGTFKLGMRDKSAIRAVLKNVSNPNKRSILIAAVGKAVAENIIAAGTSVGNIVTSVVAPVESRKAMEAHESRAAQEAIAASNERIATKAIEAGVWNQGITGLPTNPAGSGGQEGSTSGGKTTGSFLGG